MVLVIPGVNGLFSVLQEVLRKKCDQGPQVHISVMVHDSLLDFCWLAFDLALRQTRIAELVPTKIPSTLGTQDASGKGTGVVHFVPLPDGGVQLMLW
jgi:hypothetical protein